MHHDDTAPTSPQSPKTPSQAVRPTKTAKNPPKVAKRGSGRPKKKAPAPRYKKKAPHLIAQDAQAARVRRAVAKEEEVGEVEVTRGRTILLGEMAEFLNEHFSIKPPLNEFTPYDWWRRHKIGTLSTPLPKPQRMIGTGPLFLATDIVRWYKNYNANKGRWGTGA